jgi:hypothetical protein
MARNRSAAGKNHRPGHIGRSAPQFAVDEIGDAAEKQADRGDRRGYIAKRQDRQAAAQREYNGRNNAAEKAAVKRHAAVPQFENLERTGDKVRKIVEQNVPDTAAEDDPERDPDDEIVELGDGDRRWAAP